MKRIFRIVCVLFACAVGILWIGVLTGNRQDYIEWWRHKRIHFLLFSDRRGVVFDVFIAQSPPEKAPGPPGSKETQRWMKQRAERSATAYSRHFGFEKGLEDRHGQDQNDLLYFYGVDHYFAVPHLLVIFLFALPVLLPLRHHLRRRARGAHNGGPTNRAA